MIQAIADPAALRQRLLARIEELNGCWQWQGAKKPSGYGNIWVEGKYLNTHRAAYIAFVGPIPPGLVLDHLCRNKSCVNPEHLEPVTMRENVLRGESPTARAIRTGFCLRGHAQVPEALNARGRCRGCDREYNRAAWARRVAARKA